MIKVGDYVDTNSISGDTFRGEVISLDKYGFAYVSFDSISEARVQVSELRKVEFKPEILAIIEANKVLKASGINTLSKLSDYTLTQRIGMIGG